MLKNTLTSLFGSSNQRILKGLSPDIQAVGALEVEMRALDDAALRDRTIAFKQRLENGEPVDNLMCEAFATVREAAKRVLGQRHFDVQIAGGIILHQGKIAEMKTGEGKTLVSTLPAYLNALSGKGVHIVTVNDYLANRDSEWMGQIYRFLGMETGCIVSGVDDTGRKKAYSCSITYATNNELGFDYLRDNLRLGIEDISQRAFHYAIIDEVDSILIDEARTPLIISGPSEERSDLYLKVDRLIAELKPQHYEMDEKQRSVALSEEGGEEVETLVQKYNLLKEGAGLYDIENISILHHIIQALKANHFFKRDKDYILNKGEVIIIDEFTGRMMQGRRYSDGLHQAIEAKEKVHIRSENQTIASVTFQNYFRNYPKLSGMTGTALTESAEFGEIYNLDVVEIPTHKPMKREDLQDNIYRTNAERDRAVLECIKDCYEKKQPILVGTTSIEKTESLSVQLKKEKVPHNVLNARYHESEAAIIAEAGRKAAVTIATNMAGRGTDIQLGGNLQARLKGSNQTEEQLSKEISAEQKEVLAAGGLFILGTERHESRRIDNQLRGRSGRQGDAGRSQFFISLQDDLMRIFGAERMDSMLKRLGLPENEAISHPWVSKAIERAQRKVEEQHFEIRKQLLRFDDVMNDQRKAVFGQRREIMQMQDGADLITDFAEEAIDRAITNMIPEKRTVEEWNIQGLHEELLRLFGINFPLEEWVQEEGVTEMEISVRVKQRVNIIFKGKKERYGEELINLAAQSLLLQTLDSLWKDHLNQLDHLRQGISLRAYGQRDPLNEYRREAFLLFESLLAHFREMALQLFCRVEINRPIEPRKQVPTRRAEGDWGRVSRNAPCPCGSGKKYKYCHGKL